MTNEIEQMFGREGHRLKAAMEKLNELGAFGGEVYEATDEWGWELACDKWGITATFADAFEYDGDVEEVGREANVTVFGSLEGGQLLPSFVPKNYTDDVWCDLSTSDGREEFLRRLADLEECLPEFAAAIREGLGEFERSGALSPVQSGD